jgi:hypothetical protein
MYMEDRVILKRPDQMTDDIHLFETTQEPLVSGGLFVQVGGKEKFNLGRGLLPWSIQLYKAIEAYISNLRQSYSTAFSVVRIWLFAG